MNSTDFLSWLLAIVIVAAIIAGAYVTLAVLRPDAQTFVFDAGSFD